MKSDREVLDDWKADGESREWTCGGPYEGKPGPYRCVIKVREHPRLVVCGESADAAMAGMAKILREQDHGA